MPGIWNRGNPNGVAIRNMGPNHGTGYGTSTATATGTILAGLVTVRVPIAASTTGNYWSNNELGTVLAQAFVVWTTAGTGNFNLGVSSDGTSGQGNIITSGTMLAAVPYGYGTVAATLTTGIQSAWFLVGPAGSGTKNTVTVIHTETVTSTAVGYLVVQYVNVQ